MPTLRVRNVPEELHRRLKQGAEAQNRSLSAEVITLLTRSIEEVERGQETSLNSIHRRRFFELAAVGAPDSTTLLRESRGR